MTYMKLRKSLGDDLENIRSKDSYPLTDENKNALNDIEKKIRGLKQEAPERTNYVGCM